MTIDERDKKLEELKVKVEKLENDDTLDRHKFGVQANYWDKQQSYQSTMKTIAIVALCLGAIKALPVLERFFTT